MTFVALCSLSLGVYIYADIARQPASVITTTAPNASVGQAKTVTIARTAAGYEPRDVVVAKGTTIVWENQSNHFHWPASDPYPSHTNYPAFDAGRALAPGESWQFTFDRVGQWGFHDHIKASVTGTVFVEDPNAEAFQVEEGQIVE